VVGGDLAGDELLAEAEHRVDNGAPAVPGQRVGGEHDPGRLGGHHLLDDDRQRHRRMVDGVAGAVGDGALGPQARPALDDGVEDGAEPADVEERVLLPGEGRLGQVFGGGRAAHRDGTVEQGRDGVREAGPLGGGQRASERRPDLVGRLGRRAGQCGGDDGVQAVRGDERAVLVGAQHHERGHVEAGVAQPDEVGALATQEIEIGHGAIVVPSGAPRPGTPAVTSEGASQVVRRARRVVDWVGDRPPLRP